MPDIFLLVISLIVILASAEMFTNGIEVVGSRLALSQAVVGSILAAIGTAMPETILPFVAILFYGGEAGINIAVGAILGAPFMLATLAFFLIGVSASAGYFFKRRKFELNIELHNIKRDLIFFVLMYGSAISLPLLFHESRLILAAGLVIAYFYYAYLTFHDESGYIAQFDELYFKKLFSLIGSSSAEMSKGIETGILMPLLQVLISISLMIGGAHFFVSGLESLSLSWSLNPLLFSLLVAPIATELPEKFNSVSWTLKGRDSLAVGNVTGAMVFQSAFPVSLGLLFTEWTISGLALLSAALALVSSLLLLADILFRKRLSPFTVMTGGILYLIYAAAIIFF
ncbi:MAG TPA: sodium:calcium antiporter [Dissulfurispiraceae bacterium]|nr:sodium:calcium antiporter [Dissulfurispiraceae bacterium]